MDTWNKCICMMVIICLNMSWVKPSNYDCFKYFGVLHSPPLKIRFVLESRLSLRITWFREQLRIMPSHDILWLPRCLLFLMMLPQHFYCWNFLWTKLPNLSIYDSYRNLPIRQVRADLYCLGFQNVGFIMQILPEHRYMKHRVNFVHAGRQG